MPKKVCGFGFDCGSMLLQPGLEPGDCPNYMTCGRATRLTPDEEIELLRMRQVQQAQREEQTRQVQQEQALQAEVWRTTRREIAIEMLMQRGCPQSPQHYVPEEIFAQITEAIAQLQNEIAQFEDTYIPPEGTIAHRYWVHRGYASYPYNKLMAPSAVFAPAQEEHPVRMIHLSRDDDPRNEEARKGIVRMQRLLAIQQQLRVAQAALSEAIMLAQSPIEFSEIELEDSNPLDNSSETNR